MEALTILDVIVGVIIGVTIFELFMYIASYFIREKENTPIDQEAKDYLQYLNSKSVAKATVKKKKD